MESFYSILSLSQHDQTDPLSWCATDLYLDQIVDAVAGGPPDSATRQLFSRWARDDDEINYRHEVFQDLEKDAVRQTAEAFVGAISTLQRECERAQTIRHLRQRQGWILHAMSTYCAAVKQLQSELCAQNITSRGLRNLRNYLDEYCSSAKFQSLLNGTFSTEKALGELRYTLHIKDLTVGVDMYRGEDDYCAVVSTLFERFRQGSGRDYRIRFPDYSDMNHVEEQILDCVATLHPAVFAQCQQHCERHAHFVDPALDRFATEVLFYLHYLTFLSRFTDAGLQFCYPTICAAPQGIYAEGVFDAALATKQLRQGTLPVHNDFRLSQHERIIIVTGPNQGGKTTFARMVGQLCYLAALGCPVPAARAALHLPDRVFTHFERQESIRTLHGKLDDELERIHTILGQATARSVLVMNESFSSTTVEDALSISSEVLHRIDAIGCIAVYVTFLDELAELLPSCVSMVGGVDETDPTTRTYQFTRRPPDGLAYAAALADKYGLSTRILSRRVCR